MRVAWVFLYIRGHFRWYLKSLYERNWLSERHFWFLYLLALERSWVLLPVWRLNIVAIVAGTGRWQLEGLDSEGEVLVIWVVDQEPVVDVLLETLGLVAWGDQGAGLSGSGALLDTGSLGQGLVVGLHSVDDDSPFPGGVDGSPGLDVGGDWGAEVSLLHNLLQSLHAVLSVGQDILVDSLDSLVVVLQSVLDLIGGIFRILQAPGLGVSDAALGRLVVVGLGVVGGLGLMVRSWGVDRVDSVVNWNGEISEECVPAKSPTSRHK